MLDSDRFRRVRRFTLKSGRCHGVTPCAKISRSRGGHHRVSLSTGAKRLPRAAGLWGNGRAHQSSTHAQIVTIWDNSIQKDQKELSISVSVWHEMQLSTAICSWAAFRWVACLRGPDQTNTKWSTTLYCLIMWLTSWINSLVNSNDSFWFAQPWIAWWVQVSMYCWISFGLSISQNNGQFLKSLPRWYAVRGGAEAILEDFAVPAMARIATALKERHPEVQDEHRRHSKTNNLLQHRATMKKE